MKKTIVEFALTLWGSLSAGQSAALAVAYGLALDSEGKKLWHLCTGAGLFTRYKPRRYRKIRFRCGRQSGKSTRLVASIALFEATEVERTVPAGEVWTILIVAPGFRQAYRTWKTIVGRAKAIPALAAKIDGNPLEGEGVIRFLNGMEIRCVPANPNTCRGYTTPVVILEEAGHFQNEDDKLNNLADVLQAVEPGCVTIPDSKSIAIFTPKHPEGPLYEEWANRAADPDLLHWHAPTWLMNPEVLPKTLEAERRKGEAYYRREFGAEWIDCSDSFVPPAKIDAAVARGVTERSPVPGTAYFFGMDFADRGDDCCLSVSHNEGRSVVQDLVRRWEGKKGAFHDIPRILEEVDRLAKAYRPVGMNCDMKYMAQFAMLARKHGARFERQVTLGIAAAPMYELVQMLFLEGRIQILDVPAVAQQLKRLETDADGTTARGRDDLAVATCISLYRAGLCAEAPPAQEARFVPFRPDIEGGEFEHLWKTFSRGEDISPLLKD